MNIVYLARPCAHCRVYTRVDCLHDVSDLVPLSEPVCEECNDELIAESHEGQGCCPCTCDSCERVRVREERARCAAEARVCGGLKPITNELLGPAWLDEGGCTVTAVAELTAEDQTVLQALEDIEREIQELKAKKVPVTRESAAMTLFAVLQYVETASWAYGTVEKQQGSTILPSAELVKTLDDVVLPDGRHVTVARFARRFFVLLRPSHALPSESDLMGPYDTQGEALDQARGLQALNCAGAAE